MCGGGGGWGLWRWEVGCVEEVGVWGVWRRWEVGVCRGGGGEVKEVLVKMWVGMEGVVGEDKVR